MAKWISFDLQARKLKAKTDVWHVWSIKDPPAHLGLVKWFGAWRGYGFFPEAMTVFEPDCLRDLAAFVESETVKHRKGKRAFAPEVPA
jgi:hypothetical protein